MRTENKMEIILLLYRFMVHLDLEYNMMISVASQQAPGEYKDLLKALSEDSSGWKRGRGGKVGK